MQPLSGIKIADFSHVMAGPYATHLLCLLGAEVIKIESPDRGDAMRYYGNDRRYDGMAPAFIGVNAGKKSITLDLKNPKQLEIARKIIKQSDVLVENFRPGVMKRLGLGHEEVSLLNEKLIYCSVSGYGQSGPLRDWPAIDNIVQATCGMMSLSGDPGDPPTRVGFPAVDTLTGQTAAFAILAALLRRHRDHKGEYIDVAMFDASMAFMTSAVVPFLITGKNFSRTGNVGFSGQPTSALFPAKDGRIISLGVVQQHQFVALAKFLDCENWLSDPRFSDSELRRKNADALREELLKEFCKRDALEWEQSMSEAGIPCGMVREVSEAAAMQHLQERNGLLPIKVNDLPGQEEVNIVNIGFQMDSNTAESTLAPPSLGEHNNEILQSLGYSEEEIMQLGLTGIKE